MPTVANTRKSKIVEHSTASQYGAVEKIGKQDFEDEDPYAEDVCAPNEYSLACDAASARAAAFGGEVADEDASDVDETKESGYYSAAGAGGETAYGYPNSAEFAPAAVVSGAIIVLEDDAFEFDPEYIKVLSRICLHHTLSWNIHSTGPTLRRDVVRRAIDNLSEFMARVRQLRITHAYIFLPIRHTIRITVGSLSGKATKYIRDIYRLRHCDPDNKELTRFDRADLTGVRDVICDSKKPQQGLIIGGATAKTVLELMDVDVASLVHMQDEREAENDEYHAESGDGCDDESAEDSEDYDDDNGEDGEDGEEDVDREVESESQDESDTEQNDGTGNEGKSD
ncbi:hypothetical protein LTR56_022185 [Elasticomyces elasticus]|nr:hypothetical protein LTR56_022185 [Elasticomyces elasticus]KAK3631101.1 hypothetical protein LTR22_021219 [Elasticomyces elasticus]KAK4909506.1 hypothetical protein LTR49_021726 [Elasticomyces elasticus]KAK5748753.1 hypothetical protein LTS12_021194 [Elasticomyces elasticus]